MRHLISLGRKLAALAPLPHEDLAALAERIGRPQVFQPRQELSFWSEEGNRAYLLEEGWAYTYMILPNGSRQVVDIAIAGDLIGMRTLLLRQQTLSGTMVTAGVLHEFGQAFFEGLQRDHPAIAGALLWASSRDEALVVEHLADVARRSSIERVGHFILELRARLRLVGLAGDDGPFKCPLSQTLMADALGLTPIHLNRTIRELRLEGLLLWHDGLVDIRDPVRLAAIAGFDPRYLDVPQPAPDEATLS